MAVVDIVVFCVNKCVGTLFTMVWLLRVQWIARGCFGGISVCSCCFTCNYITACWAGLVTRPHCFAAQVFYVWFDAPIGYISITANYTPEWRQWWNNPDNVQLVQFMGKDNVPFHTVIFPSSLIGTGKKWTLLNKLSTTEYLNYEGTKFSKSKNMGVFGNHALDTGIPCEVWRYYLFAMRPETADCDFNWDDFACMWLILGAACLVVAAADERCSMSHAELLVPLQHCLLNSVGVFHPGTLSASLLRGDVAVRWAAHRNSVVCSAARNNNELLANLGNFINRALKFLAANFFKKVPGVAAVTPAEEALTNEVNDLLAQYNAAQEAIQLRRALHVAMTISSVGTKYLQDNAPWDALKTDRARAGTILTYAVQLIKVCGCRSVRCLRARVCLLSVVTRRVGSLLSSENVSARLSTLD